MFRDFIHLKRCVDRALISKIRFKVSNEDEFYKAVDILEKLGWSVGDEIYYQSTHPCIGACMFDKYTLSLYTTICSNTVHGSFKLFLYHAAEFEDELVDEVNQLIK